jgi:hypothetical protein
MDLFTDSDGWVKVVKNMHGILCPGICNMAGYEIIVCQQKKCKCAYPKPTGKLHALDNIDLEYTGKNFCTNCIRCAELLTLGPGRIDRGDCIIINTKGTGEILTT